jgi:hypothetical protein
VAHMIASIVLSLIILGYLADRLRSQQNAFAHGALKFLIVIALIVTLVPSWFAAKATKGIARHNLSDVANVARSRISGASDNARCDPTNGIARAPCLWISPSRIETIRYVIGHTTPDQRILVANGINDKTFANDNSLYFLAGRQPATKWSEFDPGLQNSELIQAKMVEELERHQPPLVILDTEWDDSNEPNGSARHSGVMLLDDYIHLRYQQVAEFKPYIILQRHN